MQNTPGKSAELVDPSGIISELEFQSAEDDARYQCLLTAALASATVRDMSANPVVFVGQPIGRGAYATWCKTLGSGAAVDQDLASCQNYLQEGLSAPGTEALQLYATWNSVDDPVQFFGLESHKLAVAGAPGFNVRYLSVNGSAENFYLIFTSFDGVALDDENTIAIGSSYAYIDQEEDIRQYYRPDLTLSEQTDKLVTSAAQFRETVVADLEALRSQTTQVATGNALAKANAEIDRRIALVDANSESLHALAVEQLGIHQCANS